MTVLLALVDLVVRQRQCTTLPLTNDQINKCMYYSPGDGELRPQVLPSTALDRSPDQQVEPGWGPAGPEPKARPQARGTRSHRPGRRSGAKDPPRGPERTEPCRRPEPTRRGPPWSKCDAPVAIQSGLDILVDSSCTCGAYWKHTFVKIDDLQICIESGRYLKNNKHRGIRVR